MKKTTKVLSLVIALAMLCSLSVFASGEASAESTADMTVSSYGSLDTFNRDDSGYVYVGYDVVDGAQTEEGNWTADTNDFVLDNDVEGAAFTAVHAEGEGSDITVTGYVNLYNPEDDSEGVHASDFSGVGCAIVLANNATAEITDAEVYTDGFVRAALILDNYARAWVKDSTFITTGANPLTEAYEGYENSANTGVMLSPPWVLGIQGGIRTVNVLDNEATLVIENSYLASGGWGVISTDGCTDPLIYVVDSTVQILPESEGGMDSGWALFGYDENAYGSGYGAYIIGNVNEQYYGTIVTGATFGAIAREGTVEYQSSNGDITITAADDGSEMGTIEGAGASSEIDCVYGVQTHSSEDTTVSYLDGTVVNAEEACFLYRSSGHSYFTADNATLNSNSGIILQMMDDDDPLVGGFSPFNEFFYEEAGSPSVNGSNTGAWENNAEVNMSLTNGLYEGNLYNGTGYYGGQTADVLNVTIGEDATLQGDIALTATFHGMPYSAEAVEALGAYGDDVAYELLDGEGNVVDDAANAAFIQFTQFSIRQYFMLCHVQNVVFNNGYAGVNVEVTDNGCWIVTDVSLINSLTVGEDASVYGTLVENEDGTLMLIPSDELLEAGTYGTAVEAVVAESSGMGNAGGGSASGEASGEASDEASAEASAETTDDATSWAAYQEYLIAEAGANAPDLDEFKSQVYAINSWDELDQTVSPWDQMFTTIGLSTYDDFVANGGAGGSSLVEGTMG